MCEETSKYHTQTSSYFYFFLFCILRWFFFLFSCVRQIFLCVYVWVSVAVIVCGCVYVVRVYVCLCTMIVSVYINAYQCIGCGSSSSSWCDWLVCSFVRWLAGIVMCITFMARLLVWLSLCACACACICVYPFAVRPLVSTSCLFECCSECYGMRSYQCNSMSVWLAGWLVRWFNCCWIDVFWLRERFIVSMAFQLCIF